jgi:hypothetical protein
MPHVANGERASLCANAFISTIRANGALALDIKALSARA